MDSLDDRLRARMTDLHVIVAKARSYLALIEDMAVSINPASHAGLLAAIGALQSLIIEIPAIPAIKTTPIERVNNLYNSFALVDTHLITLMEMFDNQTYARFAMRNRSTTYTASVHSTRAAAHLAYETYLDNAIVDDDVTIDGALATIKSADALVFALDHETHVNKFTIKLASWVIARTSGEVRRRVEQIVERQKDIVLGVSRVDLRALSGPQGMLCRYALRPITRSMPLSLLLSSLGYVFVPERSIDGNMSALAAQGPGVVAINKANGSPIEFDLSGLIDADTIAAKNLRTAIFSGLTKKLIERFDTAHRLPRGTTSKPIKRFVGKDTQSCYVFETINGAQWRMLGLNGENKVPRSAVTGLLDGATTRPHQYHAIQADVILAKCFDPKAQLILNDYADVKLIIPSSEPIRDAIIERMVRAFRTHTISSISQFRAAATDRDAINSALVDVITRSSGSYVTGSEEYLITYTIKFDGIIRAFIKELDRLLAGDVVPSRIFREYSGTALDEMLATSYRAILADATVEMDRAHMWTDYDITLKEFFLERKHVVV